MRTRQARESGGRRRVKHTWKRHRSLEVGPKTNTSLQLPYSNASSSTTTWRRLCKLKKRDWVRVWVRGDSRGRFGVEGEFFFSHLKEACSYGRYRMRSNLMRFGQVLSPFVRVWGLGFLCSKGFHGPSIVLFPYTLHFIAHPHVLAHVHN